MRLNIEDIEQSLNKSDARDVLAFVNDVLGQHESSNRDSDVRTEVFINDAWVEPDMKNSQMVYSVIQYQILIGTGYNETFYFINHRAKDFGCQNRNIIREKDDKEVLFQGELILKPRFIDQARKLFTKGVAQ